MRKIFFHFLIFVSGIIQAQTVTFQKVFGDWGSDWGLSVQQTTDGGYIVGGYSDSFSSSDDIYLIKTDSNGDTLWTRVLGSPTTTEQAGSIQQTADGGFIMVGGYLNGGYGDVYLLKTNSSGNIQWTKIYVNPNKSEGGASVKQTADGGYIIAGGSENNGGDVYVIKTNSNGDSTWTKNYGGTNVETGTSIQQTNDGGYIVSGYTKSFGAGLEDIYLVKTNSNGDTLWTKTYGGTANDAGYSVQQTFDGGYIIAGVTYSFDTVPDAYLIKTNPNGDTTWTKIIYNINSAGAKAFSVWQTTDGGYAFAGQHGYNGQWANMYLVKTNSNGDTLWTRSFGGTEYEDGRCLQQTSDGGFIIVGLTDSYGIGFATNIYLVKTDSLGNTSGPPVGVQEQENQLPVAAAVAVYPNPFTTQATLVLPQEVDLNENPELRVYDMYGNETARVKITAQRALIQRDNLPAGMYFCKAIANETVIAAGKFVVQ